MIQFGMWEIPDEELLAECSSFEKAKQIPPENVRVNAGKQTARIAGRTGGVYAVSTKGCECADFERRGLPCKHIIRLALELGTAFDVPQFDKYAASDYDVEEDINRLVERWRAGQLTYDATTKCISALRSSASKARKRPGRPKKAKV